MVSLAAVSRGRFQLLFSEASSPNHMFVVDGCSFMPETQRWEAPPERGGMVPTAALDAEGWRQYHRFMATVDKYAAAVGTDGRPAFAVPVDASSTDVAFHALDNIAMVRHTPPSYISSCNTRTARAPLFYSEMIVYTVASARLCNRANGWIQMALHPHR